MIEWHKARKNFVVFTVPQPTHFLHIPGILQFLTASSKIWNYLEMNHSLKLQMVYIEKKSRKTGSVTNLPYFFFGGVK